MKGGSSIAAKDSSPARAKAPVRARASDLLDDAELVEIERSFPQGLTSRQIVDLFETRGIRFSEATLRKYVQLGLLPRSVRVGRKGKHRGSCGLYPANVIRRVNLVKGMMAEDLTIEQIQTSFVRFKDEIDTIEKGLRELIASFERQAKGPALEAERRRDLEREISEAKKAAGELVRRISGLEERLSTRAGSAPGTAVGGGSDLY
jgi:DNA-binding transcriptional MerR regulator